MNEIYENLLRLIQSYIYAWVRGHGMKVPRNVVNKAI